MMHSLANVSSWLVLGLLAMPGFASARALDGSTCGTPHLLQGMAKRGEARAKALPTGGAAECSENLRPYYTDERVYDDDVYQFRIHFTTDENSEFYVTEEQVEQTAEVMREVMDIENNEMGYLSPPDDSVDAQLYCEVGAGADGGNGYYDIYFVANDGYYGYAQPMTLVDSNGTSATSFLALSTWILADPGWLKVTVAHEFFHAVQFSYDAFEHGYWMENTAVWMEEQTYDDVDDYINYVPYAYESPEQTLEAEDIYQYSHGIWPMFIAENTSADIIQEIWEVCASDSAPNALQAQKSVLDQVWSGGFSQAVLDFRGMVFDTSQFSEGDLINERLEKDGVSLAIAGQISTFPAEDSFAVAHTAGSYLEFRNPGAAAKLNLCYAGSTEDNIAKAFGVSSDGTVSEIALAGSAGQYSLSIESFGSEIEKLVLVSTYIAVPEWSANDVIQPVVEAYAINATLGEEDCIIPEVDQSTTNLGTESEVVVGCGGCLVVESNERSTRSAANFTGFVLGALLLMRRRRI